MKYLFTSSQSKACAKLLGAFPPNILKSILDNEEISYIELDKCPGIYGHISKKLKSVPALVSRVGTTIHAIEGKEVFKYFTVKYNQYSEMIVHSNRKEEENIKRQATQQQDNELEDLKEDFSPSVNDAHTGGITLDSSDPSQTSLEDFEIPEEGKDVVKKFEQHRNNGNKPIINTHPQQIEQSQENSPTFDSDVDKILSNDFDKNEYESH